MSRSIFAYVKDRPEELLGVASSLNLRSFIVGLQTGFRLLGIDSIPEMRKWALFRQKILNETRTNQDECLALYEMSSSPSKSLELFFREWEMFEQESFSEDDIEPPRALAVIDLFPFLQNLRQRPHFYVLSKTPMHLKALLSGMKLAVEWFGGGVRLNFEIDKFATWMTSSSQRQCPWDMELIVKTLGNEETAFERFFHELEAFQKAASG